MSVGRNIQSPDNRNLLIHTSDSRAYYGHSGEMFLPFKKEGLIKIEAKTITS